jgi:hypothetical protein|tara:strand:- start:2296 stop:2433 length:138 start_codon:yes stop_codon:yes gene_type:complete
MLENHLHLPGRKRAALKQLLRFLHGVLQGKIHGVGHVDVSKVKTG